MQTTLLAPADPWTIEIIVVTGGAYSSGERRSISRDVQRGLLLRLLQGAYVERSAFEAMRAEEQHVVRMRALTATSSVPVVFSHWSAGVLQGLPVLRERLRFLHITVEDEDVRHRQGVKAQFFLLGGEQPVQFGDLRATGVGRTVVDIAGGSDFEEGVMAADAALAAGVPRALLLTAVEVAGSRRASRRIGEVVAFAHPGAESAGESRSRVTMLRLGVEVPELQHRIVLSDGSNAFLDFFFRSVRVGGEFDGEQKFLDPRMAPEGAGRAVIAEKRREDAVRADLRGLARFGWMEAGSPSLLRSILARAGVVGTNPRTDLAAYAAEAVLARPRRRRRSRWRDASSSKRGSPRQMGLPWQPRLPLGAPGAEVRRRGTGRVRTAGRQAGVVTDTRTERLVLHPILPAEAARIVAGSPGPEDAWHPEYPWGDELGPLGALVTATNPDPVFTLYQVREAATGLAIGGIGFFGPPDSIGAEAGMVELGYGLVPAARGRGFATEALVGLTRIAFAAGAVLVRADTDLANRASQHVLDKAGFTEVRRDGALAFFELRPPAAD